MCGKSGSDTNRGRRLARTDACVFGRAWTDEGDVGDGERSASKRAVWENIRAVYEDCKRCHQTILLHPLRI